MEVFCPSTDTGAPVGESDGGAMFMMLFLYWVTASKKEKEDTTDSCREALSVVWVRVLV